ncbi:MAG: hypothetical protein AB7O32_12225 [Vicinamibacterales bacterium]
MMTPAPPAAGNAGRDEVAAIAQRVAVGCCRIWVDDEQAETASQTIVTAPHPKRTTVVKQTADQHALIDNRAAARAPRPRDQPVR